jgi:trehalose 6-phosphate phosphatase
MTDLPPFFAELRRHRAEAGIFCDLDGTLAPIVVDPSAARPVPGAAEVLDRLAQEYACVAVISGRPVSFLAEVLGSSDPGESRPRRSPLLFGLYGLEWTGQDGSVHRHRAGLEAQALIPNLVQEARVALPEPVYVEDKGVALGLHWRPAPDWEPEVRRVAAQLARKSGLSVTEGRMCLELRPFEPMDKGKVVDDLMAPLRFGCFFGDDRGDLAAFSALDRALDRGALVAKVAVASPESPAELLERADETLPDPFAVLERLRQLL